MLTKQDLQAIQGIVETTVDNRLDKKLKPIKRDLRKIKNDVSVIIDAFDRRDVHLQKRVKRIGDHLGIVQ